MIFKCSGKNLFRMISQLLKPLSDSEYIGKLTKPEKFIRTTTLEVFY